MKVVILAGGRGTRLAEETDVRPKPMVEIGGLPIVWHIMKGFSHHGFDEFALALGYKGDFIKRWFLDRRALAGDISLDMHTGQVDRRERVDEAWRVHLVDTGLDTLTGGRVKRLAPMLKETFVVTYGDGVADVDVKELVAFHKREGRLATITAVRPPARFGAIEFDGNRVERFSEKPQAGEGWINGGFMVLEPAVLDLIPGDDTSLEVETLEILAKSGQLSAFRHPGFWQCMDTLRDKLLLQSLWEHGQAPWKQWA
ncbi:MAG: glucose-1-phosphate cytidylyltransferase [Sandaracinaceae bacterium]|nr:glucose-1-phosphate cytidylyltransferase [Sandaracinaceae bacterium]